MNQQAQKYRITVIGCGKMGASMIHGWLKANLIERAKILDPFEIDDSLSSHNDLFHVKLMESLSLENTDIIILAVKPQIMDIICADLIKILPDNIPVLSIAAGKGTAYFQDKLKDNTPIIRTMPNTPAAIGKGMSALCATEHVSEMHKEIANALMSAIGKTIWIDDEAQMDAVTAVSGSGPAYVFHLIEALAKSGTRVGLSPEHAMILARQTIIGSAALAESEPDTDASILRQNVTSPKGTTEAALNVLMDGEFQEVLDKAVQCAFDRGIELNKQ